MPKETKKKEETKEVLSPKVDKDTTEKSKKWAKTSKTPKVKKTRKTAQDFSAENPFKRHEGDTGSPEVQIRLLSAEIKQLQDHLVNHSKDYDAKRSLLKKVARRRKFLKYLKATKLENYQVVSKKLWIKV